eukprot:1707674-Rhodomonas_salina.1
MDSSPSRPLTIRWGPGGRSTEPSESRVPGARGGALRGVAARADAGAGRGGRGGREEGRRRGGDREGGGELEGGGAAGGDPGEGAERRASVLPPAMPLCRGIAGTG